MRSPFPFTNVCEVLDIESSYLRRDVVAWRDRPAHPGCSRRVRHLRVAGYRSAQVIVDVSSATRSRDENNCCSSGRPRRRASCRDSAMHPRDRYTMADAISIRTTTYVETTGSISPRAGMYGSGDRANGSSGLQKMGSNTNRRDIQNLGHILERVRPVSVARHDPPTRLAVELSLCGPFGSAAELAKILDRSHEDGRGEPYLTGRLCCSGPQITKLSGANDTRWLERRDVYECKRRRHCHSWRIESPLVRLLSA